MSEDDFKDSILKGRVKQNGLPWQKYLEGKELLLFKTGEGYNLISIKEEVNGIENLCKYIYENERDSYYECGYESLDDFIEECKLGNDGFGFDKDEIELIK